MPIATSHGWPVPTLMLLVACAPAVNSTQPVTETKSPRTAPSAGSSDLAPLVGREHAAPDIEGFVALGDDRSGIDLESHLSSTDIAATIDGNGLATECANHLARAQWRQDIVEVANPAAHFDNCQIDASIAYLREAYTRAEAAATRGDASGALGDLGRVLHSVLDFYAHTNFVELAAKQWESEAQVTRPQLWSGTGDPLAQWKGMGLKSGTVMWESGDLCKEPQIGHGELNKDKPTSPRGALAVESWKVTHYRAAADLSKAAALELVRETLKKPTWAQVKAKCGKLYGFGLKFDERKD